METMKTPHQKNTPPAPSKATPMGAELAAMDGVPCQLLRFGAHPGRDLQLPDTSAGMTLAANDLREITYLPKAMLYRVVQRSREPKAKTRTIYLPREWAAFEPLE